MDIFSREHSTESIGSGLHAFGEVLLEAFGEVEIGASLQCPCDAAFAALRIDPDDGFVGRADVLWVEGEVGDFPDVVFLVSGWRGVPFFETFVDGVLVGAAVG